MMTDGLGWTFCGLFADWHTRRRLLQGTRDATALRVRSRVNRLMTDMDETASEKPFSVFAATG